MAVGCAFVALLVGGCAPQSDGGVVTHEGRRQRDVVLDIDGPPDRSVEMSEFVFESGPVSSRVKGRAIVIAEGPPDLMVLECTGFRETDAAEFPVSTWIRLTVDETTAVVYVQRTRLSSEGQ